MRAIGSAGIAPRIFDFGIGWRWVASLKLRLFYPQGKRPWYPLDRRLVGPQSRSGEEKNSKLLPGLETLIIQPIAQHHTTELSWLHEISWSNENVFEQNLQ
jgi:hypothetical protein